MRNLLNEEKGRIQPQHIHGTFMALAYRLVPWLEGLPGSAGNTNETVAYGDTKWHR